MRIKIYQINKERDTNHMKFDGPGSTPPHQDNAEIDASLYDEVFSGMVACKDLEEVFTRFNTTGHPLHRGHALSVSDIVVNDSGTFYCDGAGFKPVDFNLSFARKPDNLLKIVYVEPQEKPYITEVTNTLKGLQKAVCGYIETVYNGDGTIIVCNEEAKLLGMDGNRRFGDGSSIIAGPFFVVGDGGEDFRSLTDMEAQKYMERFAEPEDISPEETQADNYFFFRAW